VSGLGVLVLVLVLVHAAFVIAARGKFAAG
jgi:hypothetical protein